MVNYFCRKIEVMIQVFTDEYFMRKALDEAKEAFKLGEIPIGCVVVCNNQIIARSHNLTERLTDVTAHAEMQAITAAANQLGGKYLIDCTVYVTVEPCPMCAGALGWAQTKKVIFGARDEKRGYSLFSPTILHPKTEVVAGVLEEECSQLMKLFFANKRS
jgi:tRNA(adenine34) deaminase